MTDQNTTHVPLLRGGDRVRTQITAVGGYAAGAIVSMNEQTGYVEVLSSTPGPGQVLVRFDGPIAPWWKDQTPPKRWWFLPSELVALVATLLMALGACGDNAPADPTPDAPELAPDAGYPSCSSVDPRCGNPVNIDRRCAATGECYCDIGTKEDPMPVRCTFDSAPPNTCEAYDTQSSCCRGETVGCPVPDHGTCSDVACVDAACVPFTLHRCTP